MNTDKNKYGLIKEVPSHTKERSLEKMPATKREAYEKKMKNDQKVVRAQFYCFEPKGGEIEMHYAKYPGEPIRFYRFKDGDIYDVPMGLVNHINNNCKLMARSDLVDKNGAPIPASGKAKQLYQFAPTF